MPPRQAAMTGARATELRSAEECRGCASQRTGRAACVCVRRPRLERECVRVSLLLCCVRDHQHWFGAAGLLVPSRSLARCWKFAGHLRVPKNVNDQQQLQNYQITHVGLVVRPAINQHKYILPNRPKLMWPDQIGDRLFTHCKLQLSEQRALVQLR